MALDLGGAGNLIISWLLNPLIWILIVVLVLGATWGILVIRKKRKLLYECLELVDYSNGKLGYNLIKCGWFGKDKFLKGLWDTGDEQMETRDGEIIYNFSTEDFQEINGKRGVICFRDPINQSILVPISKTWVRGEDAQGKKKPANELLAEIAPAEYRDVAGELIKDAANETSDWKKSLVQMALWGLIIVFSLVSIIVVAQMVKHGQTEASELILEAGKTCLENAKEVCKTVANAASSGAP